MFYVSRWDERGDLVLTFVGKVIIAKVRIFKDRL